MKILFTVIMFFVTLYILDKIGLWLERKGLIFYRNKKPEGGAIGSALLELQNMVNPSARHTIEVKQNVIESEHSEDDNNNKGQ